MVCQEVVFWNETKTLCLVYAFQKVAFHNVPFIQNKTGCKDKKKVWTQ